MKLTRTDATIDFDWGTGSPDASLGTDTFSVCWSGMLLVPETGNYTFSSLSSEGMLLCVNGTLVMDNFTDQSTRWIDGTPIDLTQGQMADILIVYHESTGSAVAKLKWTGPSFAGVNGAVIPQSYLFDASTITNRPAFAFSQTLSTDQNTSLPITLQGTGGTLTYSVLTTPTNGTLSGTAPNLTYAPNLNFSGTRSIASLTLGGTAMTAGTYGSTASAAANKNDIYFSGTGILDAGALSTNIAPFANPQSVTTPVNTAMDITLTGSDAEKNTLTYTIVTQPANGTLTGTPPNVHYTPVTDYAGIDSFTFKVNDGAVDSAFATVVIAVTALNTPPVVSAGPDQIVYLQFLL